MQQATMVFFSLSLSSKWGCHGPWSHCSGLFFPITGWPLAVVAVIREKLSAQCSSGWVMVLPLSRYSAAAENSASRIKSTGSTQSDSVASVRSQTHMIKKKKASYNARRNASVVEKCLERNVSLNHVFCPQTAFFALRCEVEGLQNTDQDW